MTSIINLELGRLMGKYGSIPKYFIVSENKSFDVVSKYASEGGYKVQRMELAV